MERKQFTFYRSYYEGMVRFPESEWLGYLLAVIRFGLDGIEPEGLTEVQAGMFQFVRPSLDSSRRKAEAGSLGGSHKASKDSESKRKEKDKVKDKLKTKANCGEGFLRFWERYPVKLGQEEAQAQWEGVCEDQESILSGLENWIRSESWKRENGRFIPKPEKWLRERWWEQSPKQTVPMGASGRLGKAEVEAIERLF